MLDNVVCRLLDVGIRNLGVRADPLRRDDIHVVAVGEVVERIVRRDEIALPLGNLCDLLCDLGIERVEVCKILLQILLNLLFMRGEQLDELRCRLLRCLLVECDIKPEMRIDNLLAVLLHVVDVCIREVLCHGDALLLKHLCHLALEVQAVVEEEICLLDLLKVGWLCDVEMRILTCGDNQLDVHIIARELLCHILQK